MDNLFFCLNATGPIFLMMILGLFFRHIGWMDEEFASKMNKFVFKVPLPLLLFGDLATVDFSEVWNVKFVIFCFIVTLICIIISAGISCLWKVSLSVGNLFRLFTKQRGASWYCI